MLKMELKGSLTRSLSASVLEQSRDASCREIRYPDSPLGFLCSLDVVEDAESKSVTGRLCKWMW